jgi:hypothetical protein
VCGSQAERWAKSRAAVGNGGAAIAVAVTSSLERMYLDGSSEGTASMRARNHPCRSSRAGPTTDAVYVHNLETPRRQGTRFYAHAIELAPDSEAVASSIIEG